MLENSTQVHNPISKDAEYAAAVAMESHFTMRQLRCVNVSHNRKHFHVINQRSSQIVIEELPRSASFTSDERSGPKTPLRLRAKMVNTSTLSINLARGIFVMIAFLLTGFHFVFSLEALLHVCLSILATFYRDSSIRARIMSTIGILSLPVLVHSFTSITTVTFSLLQDTWQGLPYFNTRWNPESQVITHWIYTSLIIFVPALTFIFTTFMRIPGVWTKTLLSGLFSMEFFFIFYLLDSMWVKTQAALFISKKFCRHYDNPWSARLRTTGSNDLGSISTLKRIWFLAVSRVQMTYAVRKTTSKQLVKDVALLHTMHFKATSDTQDDQTATSYLPDSESELDGNEVPSRESSFSTAPTTVAELSQLEPEIDITEILDGSCAPKWWQWPVARAFIRPIEPPQKLLNADEISGVRRFSTNVNWNITSLLCVRERRGSIAVLRGPGQLREWRIQNALAFSVVAMVVIALILAAGFFALIPPDASPTALAAIFLAMVLLCLVVYWFWKILPEYRKNIKGLAKETKSPILEVNAKSTVVVACVGRKTAISIFTVGFVLFYLLPFIGLLLTPNYPLAGLFFACAVLSGHTYIFSLHELLSMRGEGGMRDLKHFVAGQVFNNNNAEENTKKRLSVKSKELVRTIEARVDTILRDLANAGTWHTLLGTLFVVCVLLAGLLVASLLLDDSIYTEPGAKNIKFFNSTVFTPPYSPTLQNGGSSSEDLLAAFSYPACQFSSRETLMDDPGPYQLTLTDFAFLSHLAYVDEQDVQRQLNSWFGENETTVLQGDDLDIIGTNAVIKLFRFNQANADVISVRGTTTTVDALIDMQLWSAALFMQLIRATLPLGTFFWTPVLPELISFLGALESVENTRVSYYHAVSDLASRQQTVIDGEYTNKGNKRMLYITGHSLGGGIAMISGAQTHTRSIGISGVNSMLSRKRFEPPVTGDELNSFTFNVIPARDPVPRIDDPAIHIANVACKEDSTDIDCHTLLRTICELQDKCGSGYRPVPCICHKQFGYSLPHTSDTNEEVTYDQCL